MANKKCVIYILLCPETEEIRYVGKSVAPKQRYWHHIQDAKSGKPNHSSRWIKTLIDRGLRPIQEIIFEVPDNESWQDHEKQFIAALSNAGCRLTNITAGGSNVTPLPPALEKERIEKIRQSYSPAIKAQMSASITKAWADGETRARIVAAQKMAASGEARRKELSRAGKMRTPEGEARRREAVRKYWADPERRAKQAMTMRESITGYWSSKK